MTETVACSVCGKVHPIDDIELVFELPDVIHALAGGERATRCNISADVPSILTTTAERARAALEYWLPGQKHWPKFEWE
jgi:hypothetical protein